MSSEPQKPMGPEIDVRNTTGPMEWWGQALEYCTDAWQRALLYWDVLRRRGNQYIEHIEAGQPPVLAYDYELIMDGREFQRRPVNYGLVRIIPPQGVEVDAKKRPVFIIDPRAGHGPGIGGFKKESEIGVALEKGNPVYFVIFYPDPVPGQTLADVQKAEVRFIEEVQRRHPDAPEPSVIGNCQGGWASMLVGADRPDVTGPLVVAGSPLSYWSGVDGANPMRYRGGLNGGSWMASLWADLGNGRFDGAHLVQNFEDLNPANTYWTKLYNLYSKVDTEEKRFLEFEKWWGGFYSMTSEEIHFILDSLFVGNKLEQGGVELDGGSKVQLGNLEDPVVVFASKGDNITPPQQALNWIAKVYGSVEEIKRQEQVLVYRVHEKIGHLGIFVSGSVAKKEHREIVESLEQTEFLSPGLYEMIIEDKPGGVIGEYDVRFEERDIQDILAHDDGFQDEEDFSVVAAVSEMNDRLYKTFLRPWIRAFTNEHTAEFLRQVHPLRTQRYMISDRNPWMWPIAALAPAVRENRLQVSSQNPLWRAQQDMSARVVEMLNTYRDVRDRNMEQRFKAIYNNPVVREAFTDTARAVETEDRVEEHKRRVAKLVEEDRRKWMSEVDKGGFAEGVMRVMLAVAGADRSVDREEFNVTRNITKSHDRLKDIEFKDLRRISKEQSRIIQTDMEKAIEALPKLLPTPEERDEALGIARDVMMADGVMQQEEEALMERIRAVLMSKAPKADKVS